MEIKSFLTQIFKKEITSISPLLGGMMNESYVFKVDNKRYVLYISSDQANEMVNREYEKYHQNLINCLGITSKNIYFDTKKGIKINEFIEGKSLNQIDNYDANKVSDILKKMHESKYLAKEDYLPFVKFINYEKQAKQYINDFSPSFKLLKETLFSNEDFLTNQEKVICHNDFQKSNIVKDENDNYFMIDFEFVANNDPIYDIAAFGNNDVKDGYNLLLAYYKTPNKEQIRRFYLWRIFLSLQWHLVALIKHYTGEGKIHQINFLDVSEFFLANALQAFEGLKKAD